MKPRSTLWINPETRETWPQFISKKAKDTSADAIEQMAQDSEGESDILSDSTNAVLVSASEDGSVGVYIPANHIIGRKSSGDLIALTAADIISILSAYSSLLPTSDPHVAGQWWANSNVVTISSG